MQDTIRTYLSEDSAAALAVLLHVLLVVAVGADDFRDVVPLEHVVLVRVVTEATLVCLSAAGRLKL